MQTYYTVTRGMCTGFSAHTVRANHQLEAAKMTLAAVRATFPFYTTRTLSYVGVDGLQTIYTATGTHDDDPVVTILVADAETLSHYVLADMLRTQITLGVA